MSLWKRIWGTFLFGLVTGACLSSNGFAAPEALNEFQWKNRLIIVCDLALEPSDIELVDPKDSFPPKELEFVGSASQILSADNFERKLVLLIVTKSDWIAREFERYGDGERYTESVGDADRVGKMVPNSVVAYAVGDPDKTEDQRRAIANYIDCQPGDQLTALVGLDGDVKQTWYDEVPSPEDVFALIDAMPMRLNELRSDRAE